MPSRAFHHKNRHGCTNCKHRRKRCDQQKPICRGCARRRSLCVYDFEERTSIASSYTLSAILTLDLPLQAIISIQIPYVEISDLELVNHYSYTSSKTFDTMPGLSPIRHLDIVKKAPDYPYLLYGLLAVSALHLQFTAAEVPISKRFSYAERAVTYQQLALSSYIPRLISIDDTTCHSIFGFSVMLTGLGFGFLRCPEPCHRLDPDTYVDKIISIFELLLGAVAVANAASVWITACRSEPLLLPLKAALHLEDGSVGVETHNALRNLVSGIHTAQAVDVEKRPELACTDISAIYQSAIPELYNVFRSLRRPAPDNFLGVIGWAAFVDSSFTSLLKERHPAALVILAYYGLSLHALEHTWWLHGVGSELVKSVAGIIGRMHGEEWQGLLRWPLERIGQPFCNATQATTTRSSTHMFGHNRVLKTTTAFETAFAYTYTDAFVEP